MEILAEKRAEEFLEKEGFPVAERYFVTAEKEALSRARALGYPIVMKVSSSKIIHKSEVSGVITDVRNESEVKSNLRRLLHIRNCEEVILQERIDGRELLVGIKDDPVFGHAIAVGAGGIFTEILKDVTFRICPVTKEDAKQMLEELKIFPILKGFRNKPSINFKEVYNLIVKLSHLPIKYSKIKELDINPLLVSDKKAVIADARIVLA